MDFATLIGLIISSAVVILSICFQEGAIATFDVTSLGLFFDIRSFFLVLGGTFGAAITQYPFRVVFRTAKAVLHTSATGITSQDTIIKIMAEMAEMARSKGVSSLQNKIQTFSSPFIRKGLQLAVDGLDPASIKSILEAEIDNTQVRHERCANVLESMATYAPALGMIGTVIGLVQMLKGMRDPSSIGPKMALALITTFYGVVLANLVFLPLAGRLRLHSREEIFIMEAQLEGIIGIASGENPKLLYEKLTSFQSPKDRKSPMLCLEKP